MNTDEISLINQTHSYSELIQLRENGLGETLPFTVISTRPKTNATVYLIWGGLYEMTH